MSAYFSGFRVRDKCLLRVCLSGCPFLSSIYLVSVCVCVCVRVCLSLCLAISLSGWLRICLIVFLFAFKLKRAQLFFSFFYLSLHQIIQKSKNAEHSLGLPLWPKCAILLLHPSTLVLLWILLDALRRGGSTEKRIAEKMTLQKTEPILGTFSVPNPGTRLVPRLVAVPFACSSSTYEGMQFEYCFFDHRLLS